jgi:hypothetical protein
MRYIRKWLILRRGQQDHQLESTEYLSTELAKRVFKTMREGLDVQEGIR